MAGMNGIHEFAKKYHLLYANPQTKEEELRKGFSELCFKFNFDMDAGEAFRRAYGSKAFNNLDEEAMDKIDDYMILASGIFSKWRYITHWSWGESLLDDDNRTWFISAFAKLADLTDR